MSLFCRLSGHIITSALINNDQGFEFSLCPRCGHDMIRSSAEPNSKWRTVPRAFRISWGSADLSKFERLSWVEVRQRAARLYLAAMLLAVRAAITTFARNTGDRMSGLAARAAGVSMALRVVCFALAWRAGDQFRRMRRRMAAVVESTKHVVLIGQPKLLKRRWSFIVQVTVRRDMGFAPDLQAA